MDLSPVNFEPLVFLLVEDLPEDIFLMTKAFEEARICNRIIALKRNADVLPYLRGDAPYAGRPRPDVILFKSNASDSDARRQLNAIRQDSVSQGIEVIAILEANGMDPNENTFDLDVEVVLSKPIRAANLVAAVGSLSGNWLRFMKRSA